MKIFFDQMIFDQMKIFFDQMKIFFDQMKIFFDQMKIFPQNEDILRSNEDILQSNEDILRSNEDIPSNEDILRSNEEFFNQMKIFPQRKIFPQNIFLRRTQNLHVRLLRLRQYVVYFPEGISTNHRRSIIEQIAFNKKEIMILAQWTLPGTYHKTNH